MWTAVRGRPSSFIHPSLPLRAPRLVRAVSAAETHATRQRSADAIIGAASCQLAMIPTSCGHWREERAVQYPRAILAIQVAFARHMAELSGVPYHEILLLDTPPAQAG